MSWGELFERAEALDVDEAAVRAALARHRERDDEADSGAETE